VEARKPKRSVELTAGSEGIDAAFFLTPGGGRLSAGVRAGLGYEWADFRWDDPTAALALRWRLLTSERWAWWVGAEAGAARIDTGYARFLVPFAGAVTGGSFGFTKRFGLFLEAGGRYGRPDLESEASLEFLEVRYEETYFIDPSWSGSARPSPSDRAAPAWPLGATLDPAARERRARAMSSAGLVPAGRGGRRDRGRGP
jgi:hypothetical protein